MKARKYPILAPSILSADFSNLAEEIKSVEKAGTHWIHFDIMDGHFVPNITFGPMVVKALRAKSKSHFDCHLMVSRPEDWIESFAEAGANTITVHAEATFHLHRLVQKIKSVGCQAGVSINPGTSIAMIEEMIEDVDLVLLMSVNPGFGGQKFIPATLSKIMAIAELRKRLFKTGQGFAIQVDGGINESNIASIRKAGCDIFVAGSAVFDSKNRKSAVDNLMSKL